MKKLQLFVLGLLVASLVLSLFPSLVKVIPSSFQLQPNNIPKLRVSYEDHSFVFRLTLRDRKTLYIRVRPFVMFDGKYYSMTKILNYLEQNYPNVSYKKVLQKLKRAVHYGFNLTQIPSQVAEKIDLIGFKLVDLNFPLSAFELEVVEFHEEGYNVTRIHIPKANLCFSFEDLYPWGYSVENVNSTHVLVGNVTGKENLYLDPVILSNDVIYVTGGIEGNELDFDDIYNADKAGRFQLLSPRNISNSPVQYNETRLCTDHYDFFNGLWGTELGYPYLPPPYWNITDGNATLLTGYWGMRLWKRHMNQTETEITSGTPEAIVNRTAVGSGLQHTLWNCPETTLEVTDNIVMRVYLNISGLIDWRIQRLPFCTYRLSGVKLQASTWNISYYTELRWETSRYRYGYYHGSISYDSKVQSFAWTYFNSTSLDYDPRPADDLALKLNVTISNLTVSGNVTINGQDLDGEDQTETIDVTANASYITTLWWSNVSVWGVVCCGNYTIEVWQERWGVVWKQSDTQYAFDAKIIWGDGGTTPTWFADTGKQITFNDFLTVAYEMYMFTNKACHVRFGILENPTEKTTSNGVSFIALEATVQGYFYYDQSSGTSETEFYSCTFASPLFTINMYPRNAKIYNTMFTIGITLNADVNSDYFNVMFQGSPIRYPRGTWERVYVTDSAYALYIRQSATIRNLYVRNCTTLWYASAFKYGDLYLINVDSNTWTVWGWTTDSTSEVRRQYEFDANITDGNSPIQSANVTIYDNRYNNGTWCRVGSWLTWANGTFPSQDVTKEFYNRTGGNIPYSYEPINFTVEASGYQTYSLNFTLSEKTSWEIALTPETVVGFSSTWFLAGGTVGIIFGFMLILLVVKKKRDLGGSE